MQLAKIEDKESLYQKARRGGILIGLSNALKFFLTMVRIIVVARFLDPNELGLMGIVLFMLAILESLSQTGFDAALIQQKKEVGPYLNTAWTVSVARGIVLYSILFFCAPLVASFFNAHSAILLFKVVGIAFLFEGFKNIGVVVFRKELEFKKEFLFQQIEVFADIFLTIGLAIVLQSVWALVLGYIGGKGIKCLASYILHPYRPGLAFDKGKALELFRFGKHLLGSSIVILLITQGDDAVVGKLLGVTALGFYVMAYKISNMPATSITHVVSQVAFPTYSKLQDDPKRLHNGYIKALKYIAIVSVPVSGGLFVLAPELVKFFLGERWIEMVPAMRILCVFGMLRSLAGTTGPLFQGVGRPDIITKLNLAKLVLIAALIVPLTLRYGIVGASLAVTIPMIMEQSFSWHVCARIIKGKVRQILAVVAPSFAGTLLMMSFLGLLKQTNIFPGDKIATLCLIAAGALFYLLFFCLFCKRDMIEIRTILFPSLKGKEAAL